MMIDVTGIRRLGGFKLEIEFSDGTTGVCDFQFIADRTGPMVEPLKDPAYFDRVFIEDGRFDLAERLRLGPDCASR